MARIEKLSGKVPGVRVNSSLMDAVRAYPSTMKSQPSFAARVAAAQKCLDTSTGPGCCVPQPVDLVGEDEDWKDCP